MKLHNLPTFTSFMFLNERRREKCYLKQGALFNLWPSSLSLFNQKGKFTVRQHGRREGWEGREIDLFISVESGIMRTERERGRDKE